MCIKRCTSFFILRKHIKIRRLPYSHREESLDNKNEEKIETNLRRNVTGWPAPIAIGALDIFFEIQTECIYPFRMISANNWAFRKNLALKFCSWPRGDSGQPVAHLLDFVFSAQKGKNHSALRILWNQENVDKFWVSQRLLESLCFYIGKESGRPKKYCLTRD